MIHVDDNTPIWQLTVGQLRQELQRSIPVAEVKDYASSEKKYVHGINGIARLFGCSKRTAQEIKSSGKIDKAITQTGKQIVVDAELALELIRKQK